MKKLATVMRCFVIPVGIFMVVFAMPGWTVYNGYLTRTHLPTRCSQNDYHRDLATTQIPNMATTQIPNLATTQIPNQPCSKSYRKSHWITTRSIGRTGNMMFQLATLLAAANVTCRTPAVSIKIDKGLGTIFDLSNFSKIDVKTTENVWRYKGETCRHFWEMLTLDPAFNWTIGGNFQSWKNFQFHSSYIKSVFTFRQTVLNSAIRFLYSNSIAKTCPENDSLRIGMHVRRGDDLGDYKSGLRVAGVNYTIIARDYFKKMFPNKVLCFIVASNDMKWCKENIRGENVFYSNLSTPGEDIALMSLCDHSIVSVGTFGWFGAWLAGGKVVYYSEYPRRESKTCPTNGEDMMPPGWVALP